MKWKIRVADIPPEGIRIELQEEGKRFFPDDPDFGFEEKVLFHLLTQRLGKSVTVSGKIGTRLLLQCGRCLKNFSYSLQSDFDVEYRPLEKMEPGKERQLSADEMDLLYYKGGEIDLTDLVKGQIAEEIPIQPLCDEGCRGLCPHCGRDLNEGECLCAPKDVDPRFAPLKKWFGPERTDHTRSRKS